MKRAFLCLNLYITPAGEWLGYIPADSIGGAEFDMQFAQSSFNGMPLITPSLYLYSCGNSAACLGEFAPQT